jgi:hypothetical protein
MAVDGERRTISDRGRCDNTGRNKRSC